VYGWDNNDQSLDDTQAFHLGHSQVSALADIQASDQDIPGFDLDNQESVAVNILESGLQDIAHLLV